MSLHQPTPIVDMSDVDRIVRRDYPPELTSAILERIESVEVREKPRIVLACLKVAGGSWERLQGELENASGYYREILSDAEYPMATKRLFRMSKLSDSERAAIYEKDWQQYVKWLGRDVASDPPPGSS